MPASRMSAVPMALALWLAGCGGEPPAEPASRKLDRMLGELQSRVRGGGTLDSEQRREVRALCDKIKDEMAAARGGAPDKDSADRLNRLERAVDEAFAAASGGPDSKPDSAAAARALERARSLVPE